MKSINFNAIYSIWLREMKRFMRAKSRVVGSLVMPFFFLAFLGMGLNSAFKFSGLPEGIDYINFLAPGIVGMVILFSSMFAGISVLWDRQFGFLKEIMVTPVSRISIVIGRIAGGATTAILQGIFILVLSTFMGVKVSSIVGFLLAILFMILIAISFIGLGLAFASRMEDMHGFQLIMNFIIFPVFFLSGAMFPLERLPNWLMLLTYLDPLTYGVDGLRGSLIGVSKFSLFMDIIVLILFSVVMVSLGTYLFEKTEVD